MPHPEELIGWVLLCIYGRKSEPPEVDFALMRGDSPLELVRATRDQIGRAEPDLSKMVEEMRVRMRDA